MQTVQAAIAVNRFGLGARPGDRSVVGDSPVDWLDAQIDAATNVEREPAHASAATLERIGELRLARQLAQRVQAQAGGDEPQSIDRAIDRGAVREYAQFVATEYRDQVAERLRRAISTEQPFVERLVQFWSNHFAVSADKQPIGAIAGQYENEAIRPYVAGNFTDMLRAVAGHPAMLAYLDNQASIGPGSPAARAVRRNRGVELGLNENLARELLELHTLGVDAGYTQHDVTELAKVLTGWSVGRAGDRRGGRPGEFFFRSAAHEPGDKTVLGARIGENGLDEGERVLEMLALHPATARHLATKLARHFVADDPPAGLVDRLAAVYSTTGGDLAAVYRVLIADDESWREPLAKYKTPQDFVVSTYRALNLVPDDPRRLIAFLVQLGQRPLTPGSPAGWPDVAANWNGGDALLKRIEWSAAIGRRIGDRLDPVALAGAVLGPVASDATLASLAGAETGAQGLALLFASPEFQRR